MKMLGRHMRWRLENRLHATGGAQLADAFLDGREFGYVRLFGHK